LVSHVRCDGLTGASRVVDSRDSLSEPFVASGDQAHRDTSVRKAQGERTPNSSTGAGD
jgi:hypothetical protein